MALGTNSSWSCPALKSESRLVPLFGAFGVSRHFTPPHPSLPCPQYSPTNSSTSTVSCSWLKPSPIKGSKERDLAMPIHQPTTLNRPTNLDISWYLSGNGLLDPQSNNQLQLDRRHCQWWIYEHKANTAPIVFCPLKFPL